MLEKLITSKTRVKILTLFLSNIDDRYYLRELERKLDESLSPLRRQLLKLVNMGILVVEDEANLKYYRLNKNFEGITELGKIVLGKAAVPDVVSAPKAVPEQAPLERVAKEAIPDVIPKKNHVRFKIGVLTVVSIFALMVGSYSLYMSNKQMARSEGVISKLAVQTMVAVSEKRARAARPDEMVSRKWKVLPGNFSALSSGGESNKEKRKKEI